jgi:hypothetical protein
MEMNRAHKYTETIKDIEFFLVKMQQEMPQISQSIFLWADKMEHALGKLYDYEEDIARLEDLDDEGSFEDAT